MTTRRGTTPKAENKGLRVKKETIRDLSPKQKASGIKGGDRTRQPTSYNC
jgi:hypothetical protein